MFRCLLHLTALLLLTAETVSAKPLYDSKAGDVTEVISPATAENVDVVNRIQSAQESGFFELKSKDNAAYLLDRHTVVGNCNLAYSIFEVSLVDLTDPFDIDEAGSGHKLVDFEVVGNYRAQSSIWLHYTTPFCGIIVSDSSVSISDISDPFAPRDSGLEFYRGTSWGQLAVSESRLYVQDNGKVRMYIQQLEPVGWTLYGSQGFSNIVDMKAIGNALYIQYSGGNRIFDMTHPENPINVGPIPGDFGNVKVDRDRAYVTNGHVVVYDVSDPVHPEMVQSFSTRSGANDVSVSGDLAYVADGAAGLSIYRLNEPEEPTLVGYYVTEGDAVRVAGYGSHAGVLTNGEFVAFRYNGDDPTPTPSPNAPTATPTTGDLRGDLDENGKIDAHDLIMLLIEMEKEKTR